MSRIRPRTAIRTRGDGTTYLRFALGQHWIDVPTHQARALIDAAHDRLDHHEAHQKPPAAAHPVRRDQK